MFIRLAIFVLLLLPGWGLSQTTASSAQPQRNLPAIRNFTDLSKREQRQVRKAERHAQRAWKKQERKHQRAKKNCPPTQRCTWDWRDY